jgi:hypothetical protein
VIVSASRGQYLKPDSKESGFFSVIFRMACDALRCAAIVVQVQRRRSSSITNLCVAAPSKKAPLLRTADRCARDLLPKSIPQNPAVLDKVFRKA